jgi:hypothetical protein
LRFEPRAVGAGVRQAASLRVGVRRIGAVQAAGRRQQRIESLRIPFLQRKKQLDVVRQVGLRLGGGRHVGSAAEHTDLRDDEPGDRGEDDHHHDQLNQGKTAAKRTAGMRGT